MNLGESWGITLSSRCDPRPVGLSERNRRAMPEVEAKFLLESGKQAEGIEEGLRSAGWEVCPMPAREIIDRYLDTPEWHILRAGWACRWREVGGKRRLGLKSVKSQDGLIHERAEVEEEVDGSPSNGLVPGQVAGILGDLGNSEPRELFQVRNHRRRFRVRNPEGDEIEMALDQVKVTASVTPQKRAPGTLEFEELELELKKGPVEVLRRLAETVRDRLGVLPSRLSKYERGLQAVGLGGAPTLRGLVPGVDPALEKLRHRRLKKGDPAVKYAWRSLLEEFERMLVEEPKAWEGLDAEGARRMRVATRRLRSVLGTCRPVLPGREVKGFNGELKWVGRALGQVRDPEALQDKLDRDLSGLPSEKRSCFGGYQKHLADCREVARKNLVACLASERYQRFKRDFSSFLQRLAPDQAPREGGALSIGELACLALGKFWKGVLRKGRAITDGSPDEELHALRLQGKRLRYRIEGFRPVYGDQLGHVIDDLKALQDVLGEFQDTCVAIQRLRHYGGQLAGDEGSRSELAALGQLIHNERLLAAREREKVHAVWRTFDRKGRRKEILALLR